MGNLMRNCALIWVGGSGVMMNMLTVEVARGQGQFV